MTVLADECCEKTKPIGGLWPENQGVPEAIPKRHKASPRDCRLRLPPSETNKFERGRFEETKPISKWVKWA